MSNETTKSHKKGDYFLWAIIFATIVCCFVVSQLYMTDAPLYAQIIFWLFFIGLALFVASKTRQGETLFSFASTAKQEIKKVVWPTRKETGQVTMVVTLIVAIVAVFLWLLDSLLAVIARWFLGG